jgi:predicted nucleic-acid-binding protein
MKGIDANTLIRYLTQDDPVYSRKANELIDNKLSGENPGYVSLVTLAEVAWVLKKRYGTKPLEIADVIERLLAIDNLLLQNEQQVYEAMIAVKTGEGRFADALICALGSWAGCSATLTFDNRSNLGLFEVV